MTLSHFQSSIFSSNILLPSSLLRQQESLSESVVGVSRHVEILAEAVSELLLLIHRELVVAVAALLGDKSAAGAQCMGHHEGRLNLLHVLIAHYSIIKLLQY